MRAGKLLATAIAIARKLLVQLAAANGHDSREFKCLHELREERENERTAYVRKKCEFQAYICVESPGNREQLLAFPY